MEFLYFLNERDFFDKLCDNQLEKMKQVKKTIVKAFEDINLSRLLHTLNLFDGRELSYVANKDDVDYRAERTQSLRCNNFYLTSLKYLVDTKEQEEEKFQVETILQISKTFYLKVYLGTNNI